MEVYIHSKYASPSIKESKNIPIYAKYPRKLVTYDLESGDWSSTTDEDIIVKTPYIAVSYRQSDFPDREKLEELVQNVCFQYQINAYWLDFACTGSSQEEKDEDLYRIADVFRWAVMTLIVIKGNANTKLSEGWLSWGSRKWTLPEALLGKSFVCKVGKRQPVVMDLRMIANHAYHDGDDENRLIILYATLGKDFSETSERVELLCKAIRNRSSGPDPSARRAEGEFTAYPAEWVYALMGFFLHRIQPARNKSEKEAFMELLEVNGLECDESGWEKLCRSDWKEKIGICIKGSHASDNTSTFQGVDKSMLLREPPSRPNIFFGRDGYVQKAVREIIAKHPVRFTILGPGGIGKTSVVKAIIDHDDIHATFNDHRYFIACNAFVDTNAMVLAIYQIIMGPSSPSQPPSLTSVLVLLRSLPKSLLVLDNFETMWDVQDQDAIKDVISKLFGVESLSLLLTMRGTGSPEAFHWSSLDLENQLPVLDLNSAKETFLATCPSWAAGNNGNDDDLSKLLLQLDCFPLAVFIVASVASMMKYTPAQILTNISAHLKTDRDDRFNSIKASVSLSLNSYGMTRNPQCLELLKIIAYLPGSVAEWTLKKITKISDCEYYLAMLVKFGLAYKIEPDRYNVLAPVRHYILEDYPINPKSDVQRDIFDVFFELCKKGQEARESLAIKEELTIEKDNCIKVLSDALITHDKDNNCLRAIYDFSTFLLHTIPSKQLLQLAQNQIQNCDDLQLKADCLHTLGVIARILNDNDEARALLLQAKVVFENIGYRSGMAKCLQSLGSIATALNDYHEGRALLFRAKVVFEGIQDSTGVAGCLQSLGDIARMLNDYNEAKALYSEAKAKLESVGDRQGVAECLQSLGNIAIILNDYNEARALQSEAKAEFESIGDRQGVAGCLRSLGIIARMLNDYNEARTLLSQAKAEFESIGDRQGVAGCLRSLGIIAQMLNDYNEARTLLSQAKAEFESIGCRQDVAGCLSCLGDIAQVLNDYNEARALQSQARTAFERIGDRHGVAGCLRSLGDIARMLNDYNEARALQSQAKAVYESIGDKLGKAHCLEGLGYIALISKDYSNSQQLFLQANVIFVEIGLPVDSERCQSYIDYIIKYGLEEEK